MNGIDQMKRDQWVLPFDARARILRPSMLGVLMF